MNTEQFMSFLDAIRLHYLNLGVEIPEPTSTGTIQSFLKTNMKQNNFICVDVDTTGISDDSMVWRIAVKPYGGNTEIFEWYEDVEPSTLNYLGIDAEF